MLMISHQYFVTIWWFINEETIAREIKCKQSIITFKYD